MLKIFRLDSFIEWLRASLYEDEESCCSDRCPVYRDCSVANFPLLYDSMRKEEFKQAVINRFSTEVEEVVK